VTDRRTGDGKERAIAYMLSRAKNHIIFPVFKFFARFSKNHDLSIPSCQVSRLSSKVEFP